VVSRLRGREEWKFFAVLPRASRGLCWTWWLLVVSRGALPGLFSITVGVVVTAVSRDKSLTGPLAAAVPAPGAGEMGLGDLAVGRPGLVWDGLCRGRGVYGAGGVAAAGSVTLVLAAGSRLSQYIAQTVTQTQFFRSIWLDVSRRLAWLENYAQQAAAGAGHPAPAQLEGIGLDGVSFRYAGSERLVLDGISLDLPAGKVIAVVGENGAGKSTLVKLLCGFYAPVAGTISVNGRDLSTIDPVAWRLRLAGAFQDFCRFEYPLRQSVGVGDLPRVDDRAAVRAAIERVSHRFSTVRMADLIVVLDGSRVADYGTHDELIGRGGLYAELYGIQAASYRAGYG